MSSRYIENEIRDFGANPKKARKGKARKGNGVEDAILHSALRLSLQRILREAPPSELIKSRDFSVYTALVRNYLEVYWPCAGGLSAVNAIVTQLRDPINLGLTRWRMAVQNKYMDAAAELGRNPLFVYFQVKNGVLCFLDYEDIYIMVLSVLVSILKPNRTAGYCLLFLLLHSRGIGFGASGRTGQLGGYANPMELAAAYLDAAQASLERQETKKGAGTQGFTFLTGAAGVHAIGAAIAQRAGDAARCRHHAREVAAMEERAMAQQHHRSHEVMYGLAGYLNALLFIRANTREEIGEEEVPDPLILRVVDRIVSDGAEFPAEGRWGSPGSPNSPSQLEASTAETDNSGENGEDRSRSDDSNEGGTGAEGDHGRAGGDAPPGEGKANGAGAGGARADQWGEVDPDAGEWEDPNRRRSSGGGPGRSSGGRGRRGRRRKGSSTSSGPDGIGAAVAKAAVTPEASEAAAAAAAAAATVGADAGEGYGGVLTYEWHSKMYLGAAHGVSGILFVLMQALQTVYGASLLVEPGGDGAGRQDLPPQAAEQLYLIRSTVDAILETSLPEGNFPSRPGSRDDRLVQWCHGAPGVIPTLTKAYEVFEDERYLEAARHSSDVVWRRGLLTKGNGLCHGVAGNGYAFLSLRKTDASDGRHLHRARSFAGFTASAVLGPNPTAGENAFRGDPFGPGAHAHSRSSGGVGGLGRSSSHDSGNSLPSLGWPSSALGKSASAVAPSVVAAAAAATAVTAAAVSNGCGVGLRSSSASSLSTAAGSSMMTGASWHDIPAQAVPDRPMSLFEGLAGAATFLADMVPEAGAGEHAWFPSFEVFP